MILKCRFFPSDKAAEAADASEEEEAGLLDVSAETETGLPAGREGGHASLDALAYNPSAASRGKKFAPSGGSAFAAAARFTSTRPFIFLRTN